MNKRFDSILLEKNSVSNNKTKNSNMFVMNKVIQNHHAQKSGGRMARSGPATLNRQRSTNPMYRASRVRMGSTAYVGRQNGNYASMVGIIKRQKSVHHDDYQDFRRRGGPALYDGPYIFQFIWNPEVRPYIFLVCFSFGLIVTCHLISNYFHYLEGIFMVNIIRAQEHEAHHHWDAYIPTVSTICKWISSINAIIMIIGIIIVSNMFVKFKNDTHKHVTQKNTCDQISSLILRQRVNEYYNANPLGPAGRVRGVTFLRKCSEVRDAFLVDENGKPINPDSKFDDDDQNNQKMNTNDHKNEEKLSKFFGPTEFTRKNRKDTFNEFTTDHILTLRKISQETNQNSNQNSNNNNFRLPKLSIKDSIAETEEEYDENYDCQENCHEVENENEKVDQFDLNLTSGQTFRSFDDKLNNQQNILGTPKKSITMSKSSVSLFPASQKGSKGNRGSVCVYNREKDRDGSCDYIFLKDKSIEYTDIGPID